MNSAKKEGKNPHPVRRGCLAGQAFRSTRTNSPCSYPSWIRMRLRWSGRCGLMIGLQRSHKEAMMITKRTSSCIPCMFLIEIRVMKRRFGIWRRQFGNRDAYRRRGERTAGGLLKFVYAFLAPMRQSIYGDRSPAAEISAAWKGHGESRALPYRWMHSSDGFSSSPAGIERLVAGCPEATFQCVPP